MILIKSFFRRISKDFRQKELLPLKLIFFVQASTLFVLYPYLTIHMRELGINVEETAIMSAVTPFVAIVMPPLAGLVADRIGNFKILLSLFSSLGGAAALLLLLVPVGRVTVKYPEVVVMNLECSKSNGDMIHTMSQMNHHCESKLQDEVITRVESCGYMCHVDWHNQTDLQSLLSSRSYIVKYFDPILDHNYYFKYNRPIADFTQTAMSRSEIKEHRLLKNNEFYKTSIRQFSNNSFFFPTGQLYEFSCSIISNISNFFNTSDGKFLVDEDNAEDRGNLTLCKFGEFLLPFQSEDNRKPNSTPFKSKLKVLPATETDAVEQKRRYSVQEVMLAAGEFNTVKCVNSDNRSERVSITVSTVNSTLDLEPDKSLSIDRCIEKCIVTAPRRDMCSNMETVIEYNIQLTFWLYLGIRVFIGIIGGTAFAMFEGAVIAILREQKADYGLQRIYGSIGAMISSPLSGMLIDYASQGKEYTDFRPAFYLYAALKMASGVLMLTINLEFKSPAHNVVGDVISVLRNIEIAALMLACFVLGTTWGYIESFLFWLIQDLGGSRSLMGITITVGGITGIPLLVLSGPIINKIGHANVLVVGFVFYAVRLVGYSVIYNPWQCLFFEALESVTTALSFTAAVTYAAKLSTTTTDTSIQGLLGGLYYGVGKGSGSLIGGFLMKAFDTRPTYQIFAVVSLITGLVYFFFNGLYLKKRPQVEGNDIVKKKPKNKPVENGIESAIDLVETSKKKKNKKTNLPGTKESYVLKGEENVAFEDSKAGDLVYTDDKNLESIERLPEAEKSKTSNVDSVDQRKKIESSKGVTNPVFESDTNKCSVTVEREPRGQEVNESH